eukprot:symbB.v1.2.030775.t1/scaffold3490.1/size55558/3
MYPIGQAPPPKGCHGKGIVFMPAWRLVRQSQQRCPLPQGRRRNLPMDQWKDLLSAIPLIRINMAMKSASALALSISRALLRYKWKERW